MAGGHFRALPRLVQAPRPSHAEQRRVLNFPHFEHCWAIPLVVYTSFAAHPADRAWRGSTRPLRTRCSRACSTALTDGAVRNQWPRQIQPSQQRTEIGRPRDQLIKTPGRHAQWPGFPTGATGPVFTRRPQPVVPMRAGRHVDGQRPPTSARLQYSNMLLPSASVGRSHLGSADSGFGDSVAAARQPAPGRSRRRVPQMCPPADERR